MHARVVEIREHSSMLSLVGYMAEACGWKISVADDSSLRQAKDVELKGM
jgi:hypothetical protein